MPELPEVETVRRVLAQHLLGARITAVHWHRADVLVGVEPAALAKRLQGARFVGWGRRGKYLLMLLDREAAGPAAPGKVPPRVAGGDGAAAWAGQAGSAVWRGRSGLVLAVHLRMTGRLILAKAGEPRAPHTHVVFALDGAGAWDELRFVDVRRFGRLYSLDPAAWAPVLADAEWSGCRPAPDAGGSASAGGLGSGGPVARSTSRTSGGPMSRARSGAVRPAIPGAGLEAGVPAPGGPKGLALLGPEPLGPGFHPRLLRASLEGRQAPIKAVLLDQRVVAGLGNIYADEALFAAGVDPGRPAGSLTTAEVARLVRAIRRVLRAAIVAGGTTFSDYRDGLDRPGRFAACLAVYGRAGCPCPRCGHPITTRRLSGRTAHFCPRCQR